MRRRSEMGRTFAPGPEALRWAVHDPGRVAGQLQRFFFVDDVERVAFDALVEADSLHQAIEHARRQDPRAADLLHRLVQEEPSDPAESVVAQLVRNATRAMLSTMDAEQRQQPERFAEAAAETAAVWTDLQALSDDNPDSAVVARLVAWLGRRAEEDA